MKDDMWVATHVAEYVNLKLMKGSWDILSQDEADYRMDEIQRKFGARYGKARTKLIFNKIHKELF